MKTTTGLIHIYCGDGKGKTTASLGLMLRAAGRGMQVVLARFLKKPDTGELLSLEHLPQVHYVAWEGCKKFSFRMTEQERAELRARQNEILEQAFAAAQACGAQLLVLDEAVGSVDKGLLDEARLLELLQERPETLEVVLTGRNPSQALLDMADYVTEMRKVKHPFARGIPARMGIEK